VNYPRSVRRARVPRVEKDELLTLANSRRIERKAFIELSVSAGATLLLTACGGGDEIPEGGAGAGAAGGAGGNGGAGGSSAGTGAGGAGAGGASASGGKASAGTGGSSAGQAGASSGGAGGQSAGSGGTAGTPSAGSGGAGGAPGAGNGGAAGSSAGGGGAGGAGGRGMAGRGAGGASGGAPQAGAGGSSGGGGGMCGMLTITQNAGSNMFHDHIPMDAGDATAYRQDLTDHINGPTPTEPFVVFAEGAPVHTHVILFTQTEIDTLRSGGTLSAKSIEPDEEMEVHIYTIRCMA
jgi:hypothetical protein